MKIILETKDLNIDGITRFEDQGIENISLSHTHLNYDAILRADEIILEHGSCLKILKSRYGNTGFVDTGLARYEDLWMDYIK